MLVRVDACGVCPTDLKKIQKGLLPGPRIFGHEIAGTVDALGQDTRGFREGDRVVVHHHVPCGDCFYCARRVYAQCAVYKRNGTTAGFEPSGGGYAEYVSRVDWIVARGTIPIPDGVRAEEAAFVEPVNTCLKAVRKAGVAKGETRAGRGPGADRPAADADRARRRRGADRLGRARPAARGRARPRRAGGARRGGRRGARGARAHERPRRRLHARRGAADSRPSTRPSRRRGPGGRIVSFAATSPGETVELDLGRLTNVEKDILTAYSSSIDLQEEAAELVFSRTVRVAELVTHRLPVARGREAFALATAGPPARSRCCCEGRAVVTRRMQAAVLYGREDVRIESVEVPPLEPGEILLRTRVALTCGTDVKVFRRGYHARMIRPPAVFGHEVSGVVEEVAPGVESVQPGTRVVVANSAPCGVCVPCEEGRESLCDDLLFWNGAYAEFARIPARIVREEPAAARAGARLPAGGDGRAARLRRARESRRAGIQPGQIVAVIGTGPIGLMLLVPGAAARGARDRGGAQRGPPRQGARARSRRRDRCVGRCRDRRAAPAARARTGTDRTS